MYGGDAWYFLVTRGFWMDGDTSLQGMGRSVLRSPRVSGSFHISSLSGSRPLTNSTPTPDSAGFVGLFFPSLFVCRALT